MLLELGCQCSQETYTTMYHWQISFDKITIWKKGLLTLSLTSWPLPLWRIGCIVKIIPAPQAYISQSHRPAWGQARPETDTFDSKICWPWSVVLGPCGARSWNRAKHHWLRPTNFEIKRICLGPRLAPGRPVRLWNISLRRWNYSNYAPNTLQWQRSACQWQGQQTLFQIFILSNKICQWYIVV